MILTTTLRELLVFTPILQSRKLTTGRLGDPAKGPQLKAKLNPESKHQTPTPKSFVPARVLWPGANPFPFWACRGDPALTCTDPLIPYLQRIWQTRVSCKNHIGKSRALNQDRPGLTSQLGKQALGPSSKYARLTLISYKHPVIQVLAVHCRAYKLTSAVPKTSLSLEADVQFPPQSPAL